MSRASASLAMYPFGEVRAEYQRLWRSVRAHCPELPPTLIWPDDVHATWVDDDVVVKQACGWPLITQVGAAVRVIGAFEHDVPEAVGCRYRSAIVATRPGSAADFASAAVAYNSTDSLSGWVSLIAWSGRSGASLRSRAIESGSHVVSLELVRDRRAELASIDAVTLSHVRRHRPELVTGLVVVGHGPLVPSLPIVVPASTPDDVVGRLRHAFGVVVDDVDNAALCDALLISGFVPLELDDYRHELAGLEAG